MRSRRRRRRRLRRQKHDVTRRYATRFPRHFVASCVFGLEFILFITAASPRAPRRAIFFRYACTAVAGNKERERRCAVNEKEENSSSRETRGVSLGAIQCTTLRQIPAFQIVPFSFIHI